MASTEAVLKTYELLEAILSHLDLSSLTRSMRVCQTWNNLITRSTTLNNIRILVPVEKLNHCHPSFHHADTRPQEVETLGQIPLYDTQNSMALKYHKDIFWPSGQAYQTHASRTYLGSYLKFSPSAVEHDSRFPGAGDKFATVPPCQAIALRILREDTYCVVYVPSGVRVKDLRQAVEGMLETVGKFCGKERGGKAVVTGWVFESVKEEEYWFWRDRICTGLGGGCLAGGIVGVGEMD